jgi:hypothetical protein
MDLPAVHDVPRRRLLTVTGVTGIAFTLSWIAGLSVAAPSPTLTASGTEITAALAGHGTAVAAQFALTEGLPAAGLAIVSVALAWAARRSRAAVAARFACTAGVAAAVISLAQFVLGMVLAGAAAPGTAHALYEAVNRLDRAKMFALAALGLAGATSGVLPRWLRYTGIALAFAMAASGVAYLLLLQGGAVLAYVSGPLLLLFITGTGIALGISAGKPPRVTEPAVTHPGKTAGPQISRPAESRVIPPTGAAENTGQRMTPGRDAGPTQPRGPAGQAGIMTIKIRRVVRQLSAPLVILVAALFAAGVISGLFSYLNRSSVRETFIPGSSAWWQQLAVAVVACAAFGYGRWQHQRRFGRHSDRLWLLAPLGKPAARRVARTLGALRGLSGLGRALLAVFPAAVFLYFFYRDGEQVIGGLDPNFTVNAWGGPTYIGAMACHYLDGLVLMGAAAWLLDRILLPGQLTAPSNGDAPGDARVREPAASVHRPGQRSDPAPVGELTQVPGHKPHESGPDTRPGTRRGRAAQDR